MKKLFVLMLALFVMINNARADQKGRFLRIECNQDLGLLELGSNEIWGMNDYFNNSEPVYKYSIDTNGEGKSHAEMLLLNFFGDYKEPFTYQCQFGEKIGYDVYVQRGRDCYPDPSPTFVIKIIEKTNTEKLLIDDVKIGCGSKLDGIQIVVDGDNPKYSSITFLTNWIDPTLFSDDITEPITTETVDKEIKRLERAFT